MQIRVKVGFSDAWFQAFAEASSLYTDGRDITVALFRRIQDPVVTAAVPGDAAMAPGDGGPALACGYGVIDVESGFVGLYGISVAPEARRRGLGRAITVALLHAAVEQGANSAYLQVVAANAAAQGLYAQLDFVDRHAYWYRVEE